MVELGTLFKLSNSVNAMVFINAGATFIPGNNQTTQLRVQGSSAASGTYSTITNSPNIFGKANIGIKVFSNKVLEGKLEYGYQFGQGYISQVGSAKLSYFF